MNDQQDSIDKFLAEIDQFTISDFDDYGPYERASGLCKTSEEMEICLQKIYEKSNELGVDSYCANFFDYICREEFLVKIGEKDPDIPEPPEEILEIIRLEKEVEELRKLQKDSSDEDGLNDEKNIVQFPELYVVKDGNRSDSIVLGDREINLDFGDYSVDHFTGAITLSVNQGEEAEVEVELCSHFVMPSAYVKTPNGGETVSLFYYRDDEWHKVTGIQKSKLYDPNTVAKYLIDLGIDAQQDAGKMLADYFHSIEQLNRNTRIPVKLAIPALGWNKEYSSFAPYNSRIEFGAGNNQRKLFHGVCSQHGSYESWVETIKMIRDEDHCIARIALAASFASALIRPLEGMRFAINLIGKSGVGKSVALRMVAGVWGDPDTIIASFGSTVNGALLRSNFLSDIPMILDESETKKNKTDFDEFIYTMCGDYDRVKATGDDVIPTSRNCIFISGEHPLMNEKSNQGALNRVLDLNCDSYVFFEPDRMKKYVDLLDQNYGYAGRAFVENLLNKEAMSHAEEIYRRHLNSFSANRQARIPAVILTADELIEEMFFHDGIRLTPEEMMAYLRKQETSKTINNADVQDIIDEWILKEIKANGTAETERGKAIRKRGRTPAAFAFKADVLDEIITGAGGNMASYLIWADENKKILAGSDRGHKYQKQVPFNDKKIWCYVVIQPSRE